MPRLSRVALRCRAAVSAAFAASCFLQPCWAQGEVATLPAVDFDQQVRPILSNHCFQCHGPDSEHRKAGLRLDRKQDAFALRDGVAAIVPGDGERSELVARILHGDAELVMPPPDANKALSDHQRQVLVQWIEQGAPWREHWSFVSPAEPVVPAAHHDLWVDPIDRFLLRRMQRDGLQPMPRADRRSLLRRLTLDLTGMPPALQDLRAFAADDSPDAYERAVDRLLASPAYGEHMARYWLDAARYGDTHGLHLDNYREMWPYRDWVVRAFNDNLPFDQFVVEQLAGDLLPNATTDQRIASGFNRCHITTNEGGSITEEVYVRNVIDRTSTMGTVFLGLTVGCAVCHDHKFDPISQREFYGLFAFFNNLDGKPLDGNAKAHAPVLQIPSDAQTAELAKLDAEAVQVEAKVAAALATIEYREPEAAVREFDSDKKVIVWVDDELPPGANIEGAGFEWSEDPRFVHSGRRAMRRSSQGNQQHYFRNADQKLRIASGDVLFAWVYLDPENLPKQIMLQWNSDGAAGWRHRAYWGENHINYGKDGTTERLRIGELPEAGKWVRLEVPAVSVGLHAGMAVHGVAFTQFDGTSYWDSVGIETSSPQEPQDYVWVDDDVPSGAKKRGDGRSWQWVDGSADGQPKPYAGARSLRRSGRGLSQDILTDAPVPLRLQAADRLFAHVWLDPKDPPRSVQLQFFSGSWEHRVRWGVGAHGAGRKGAADVRAGDVPQVGQWVRLEVGIEEVGLTPGDAITSWAFTKVGGTVYWDCAGLHTYGPPNDEHLQSLTAWQGLAANDPAVPDDVKKAIAMPASDRSPEQVARIEQHFVRYIYAGSRSVFAPLQAELDRVDARRKAVRAGIPTTLVMQERAMAKDAFVLKRGLYDQRGEKVERITPAALPAMDVRLSRDRLGLARWLVDEEHPLTARVAVNRFWQQLFGTGIVKTSEDFGNQGERPSHPQLLDYLATRFVGGGWDVKALVKQFVMSSAYRQSSRVRPESLRLDPENRLLSRGSRYRLDGEVLRDQVLFLSGLLVDRLGGPGVKPSQPAGLWRAVGYSSSNTAKFQADTEHDKVHRRSLYTFWKRTSPPPQMTTFDAPSREECRVRRERTNTPLQALLLMNDPQYVEAARAFALRVLREGGASDGPRVAWAMECATGHAPDPADVADVQGLLVRQREVFAADLRAANALVGSGAQSPPGQAREHAVAELAAWTMVANLVFNLDAVLTKS